MERLIKIISISIIVILISCEGKEIEKVKLKTHKPDSTNVEKIKKPYKKYTYDWRDTAIVSINYNNGTFAGLTQWKDIKTCSGTDSCQPIIVKLNDKKRKVRKINVSDIISTRNSTYNVKIQNNKFFVMYLQKKNRILKKINLKNYKSKKYKLKRGKALAFGVDTSNNYYISGSPGIKMTIYDKIKNVFSENIHSSPKNFPILKYNQNLEKIDSFGRWIYTGNIEKKRNLFYDITLNQRHILCKNNYIYTCSFNYGFIEKYTLGGKFVKHLSLTSQSPVFYNRSKRDETLLCIDMEIVNEKLYILFSGPVKALSGICEYPKNKKHFIGITEIDISGNKIQKEKIYYYFPEKSKEYLQGFTMIDSKTFVLTTKEAFEFYKLK